MIDVKTLRYARKSLRLNQADIGKILGFTARVISTIENGLRPLSRKEENLLLDYFGTKGIDLTQPTLSDNSSCPRIPVRIIVEKSFDALTLDVMKEITKHADAISSLSGDWKVSCKMFSHLIEEEQDKD